MPKTTHILSSFKYLQLLCWAALAISASAQAQAQVTVQNAWARGTVAAQKASGAFMQITSIKGGRLIAAHSPLAQSVEIHAMSTQDGVMTMRELPKGLELPPAQTVDLKPGGYHFMLFGLKQALKTGQTLPLSLVIEALPQGKAHGKRETLELQIPIKPLNYKSAHD
jgi:periplasmic copper chaperone A